MKLRLVPTRPDFFQSYAAWCQTRNYPPSEYFMRASGYIWVEAEGYGLVLGVGLFESPAAVMAEEMVSNPKAPNRVIHHAVSLAIQAYVQHCTLKGLLPVLHTKSRGLARLMMRKGFVVAQVATLTRHPSHQVTVQPKPRKPAETPKPRKKTARKRPGPRKKKP